MAFKMQDAGRSAANLDKLHGWAAAVGFSLGAALLTWGADRLIAARPVMVQAAALGAVGITDPNWIGAIALAGVTGAFAILMAFGVNPSRYNYDFKLAAVPWRWSLVIVCCVVMVALDVGYLAFGGRSATYTSPDEFGVVANGKIIHHPWGQASSAGINCQVLSRKHAQYVQVSFPIAFVDGKGTDAGFTYAPGDTPEGLDWALWVAYKIRQEQWAKPSQPILRIFRVPDCARFVRTSAPAEIRARFAQLFAPVSTPLGR